MYGSGLYSISIQDNLFSVHMQQEQAKAQTNLLVAQNCGNTQAEAYK